MTDLPPRTTVPRTDADRATVTPSQTNWVLPIVLAVVIIGAIAFMMNRAADAPDPVTTAPATIEPAPAETGAGTGTESDVDPNTAEPVTPAPGATDGTTGGTTGGTTQPAP
jgi:hypothetical protein